MTTLQDTTLHDMLKADPARRVPRQEGSQTDLCGRYRTLAMPAVAAAAPYHSGSKDRTGERKPESRQHPRP